MYDPNGIEGSVPKNDFSLPKLVGVVIGVSVLTFGITKYVDNNSTENHMKPIIENKTDPSATPKALERMGINVVSSFEEDGIKGHGILHQGQPMAAYEIPGSDNFIIGDMISRHGTNLSQIHSQEHVVPHVGAKAWPILDDADYVIDQDNTQGPVLYTMTDPNCPFCLRLWQTLEPVVSAGDMQVRHIVVGILGQDSLNKAAAILEAESPSDTLHKYKTAKSNGQEYHLPTPSPEAINRVMSNNEIMREAGASGTPASYIKYPDGSVEFIPGAFGMDKVNEMIEKSKE